RVTLFRANSGKAWLSGGGKVEVDARGTAHVPFARPVALGLALTSGDTVPGLSDLAGWTDVVITPEMVGRRIPVFTAIETKESGGGRRRENQINFVQQVQKAGGIAGFAASEQQANEIIEAWLSGRVPDPL
ncbi:MAG: hypothetical protein ACRCTO_21430, partial [Pseudomonas paracarnis]